MSCAIRCQSSMANLWALTLLKTNVKLGLEFIQSTISQAKKEVAAEQQLKRNKVLAGLRS